MKKPSLVIMAAGMGSRYGGLKQMDPIDKEGNLIIDFSIYDAIKAGFGKIIFIIKKSLEEDFKEVIGRRIAPFVEVAYVYQELEKIPEGYSIPEGRVKPWGTGHAVMMAKDEICESFAVINADDYYGQEAFQKLYEELMAPKEGKRKYLFSMVGYELENTMTEYGHVARGVTSLTEEGYLQEIIERTQIEYQNGKTVYKENQGDTYHEISPKETVSMNLWGFTKDIIGELEEGFQKFLSEEMKDNPLKSEYFLPYVVNELIKNGKACVKVLKSQEKWFGMTYKEDKKSVEEAIKYYKVQGRYPQVLWTKTKEK